MRISKYTDGGGRVNNEDYLLIETKDGHSLFIVADGLGGVEAGEIASRTASEECRRLFLEDPAGFDIKTAITAANKAVLDIQASSGKKMKTTITVVYCSGSELTCSNIGDTRIYLFDNNGIHYQSIDHSVSQMAVLSGEIEASGIRCHPDRNILTKALGASDSLTVNVKSFAVKEIKAVLLCSDGFWEYVYENEMTELLNDTDDPDRWLTEMRRLIQLRKPSKNDNNTAIAVINNMSAAQTEP